MKNYLHGYGRTLELELGKLDTQPLTKRNAELLKKFHKHNVMRDLSLPRQLKYLSALRPIALTIKKDFDKATKEDYEDLIIGFKKRDLALLTIDTYKKILKVFHKWLSGAET